MARSKPGSGEAVEAGCVCPVIDNSHGRGIGGDGERHGWWIAGNCPVHGAEAENMCVVEAVSQADGDGGEA